MASNYIIWTGSTAKDNGLSLTMGNICNSYHFVGHNLHYMSALSGGKDISLYVTIKQNGTKEAGQSYYSLTTTNNSVELIDQGGSFIELKDDSSSYETYFAASAYFKGASGSLSYSDTHIVASRIIQKSNSLSEVGLTKPEVWTESDTPADTFAYVTFTSLSNAFDKTATTTTDTSAFTVDATKQLTGAGSITAKANYAGFSEGEGSKTFDYTVAASDGAEYVTDTTHYTRTVLKNNGITLKNTATTVTFVDSSYFKIPDNTKIYINTGRHTDDTSGSYVLSTIVTNTNNNCTPFDTNSVWTFDRNDIIPHALKPSYVSKEKVTLTAYNGNVATAGTVVLTAKSHDGKLENAKDTIQVEVAIPAFNGANVNVGETTYISASGLAGQGATNPTTVTAVTADTANIVTITKVTDQSDENYGKFAVKGLDTGAAKSTATTWTTSDGAVLHLGNITVAAALVATFYKKDHITTTSKMNYGDSVLLNITGGKAGTEFTVNLSGVTGATATKIDNIPGNGAWFVISLPDGAPSDVTSTLVATITPSSGTDITKSISVEHITLTLS